ncbi:GNAT family N-acetyltransferase [Streptomyces sp. ID05-26A]|nr:GNAT family N-acetyltransferase [Streptomyces sp. ID05-26A]
MPRKLEKNDYLTGFNCGVEELDEWLTKYAWINQRANTAVTYVTTYDDRVVGYYAIAVAGVGKGDAPVGVAGASPPNNVPCLLLARLAVDYSVQGKGVGAGLLADAMKRTVGLSESVGMRAMLIHSRDEHARSFYLHQAEFIQSPTDALHLFASIDQIAKLLRR